MDRRGGEEPTKTPDFKSPMWIQVESQLVDQFRLGKIHRSVTPSHSFQADYCSFLLKVIPSFLLRIESSYGVFAALSYIKNDV